MFPSSTPPVAPLPSVVYVYETSGCARAMRAASSALSRVYSRFEPGGVSSAMMNSARSSSGKNAGADSANRRHDLRQHDEHREADDAIAGATLQCMPRLRESEDDDRDADESPPPSPLSPRLGSTNDAKNVSVAIVTIAAR